MAFEENYVYYIPIWLYTYVVYIGYEHLLAPNLRYKKHDKQL